MSAPRDIVAALESVISIFFSEVRHKNRAAFILCDELVEMTCKTKAKAAQPNLPRTDFPSLLVHQAIALDPAVPGLGANVLATHKTRNDMQHNNAAATVDDPHCADAILDAVRVIDHCYAGASGALTAGLKVPLRVVALHASDGDRRLLAAFEQAMLDNRWGAVRQTAKPTQLPITAGARRYWGLVVLPEYAVVEALLNRIGAP